MRMRAIILTALCCLLSTSISFAGVGQSGGNSGSVSPGTNMFFANPDNIVPAGTGNIWFVDGSGNDSNDCKSPAKACLTIGQAISLAVNAAGDVINVMPKDGTFAAYNENVVINKDFITLRCSRPFLGRSLYPDCLIAPDSGVAIAITNLGARVDSFWLASFDGLSSTITITGSGAKSAENAVISRNFIDGGGATVPLVVETNGANYASGAMFVDDSFEDYGTGGGLSVDDDTAVERSLFVPNFNGTPGAAIIASSSNGFNFGTIADNKFLGPAATLWIDLSARSGNPFDSRTFPVITNNQFGSTLTLSQVSLPSGFSIPDGNFPIAPIGSAVTVNKTITSSAVLSATPTNILTADGDVYVTKIVGMTDGTGLAGCTNYVIKQDRAIGGTTVASQAITGLGANVTFDFANGATTALLPFSLASGGHVQDQATAAPCSGAGTIQLSVTYVRLTPYASLQ